MKHLAAGILQTFYLQLSSLWKRTWARSQRSSGYVKKKKKNPKTYKRELDFIFFFCNRTELGIKKVQSATTTMGVSVWRASRAVWYGGLLEAAALSFGCGLANYSITTLIFTHEYTTSSLRSHIPFPQQGDALYIFRPFNTIDYISCGTDMIHLLIIILLGISPQRSFCVEPKIFNLNMAMNMSASHQNIYIYIMFAILKDVSPSVRSV